MHGLPRSFKLPRGFNLICLLTVLFPLIACREPALDEPEALTNRGINKIARGDFSGAQRDFDAALERDQEHSVALLNRGIALTSQGKLLAAIADFSAVLDQDPESVDARLRRGYAYIQVAQFENAEQDFSATIAINPTQGDAFSYRAVAYYNLGQIEAAIADLMEAKVLFEAQERPDKVALVEKTLQGYQAAQASNGQ